MTQSSIDGMDRRRAPYQRPHLPHRAAPASRPGDGRDTVRPQGGLVGRNGIGKTTLLNLILGDIHGEGGRSVIGRDAPSAASDDRLFRPAHAGGARYSTFTASDKPSSCRICVSSFLKVAAESVPTVTEKSSPILRSELDRSFGRIFVPSR